MSSLLSALTIAVQFAASASVGVVVGNVIGLKIPANAKPLTKMSIGFGTLILTSIASDMAMTYVETQINEVVKTIVLTKDVIEEAVTAVPEPKKEGEG